jgi:hypothetical protein
MCPQKNSIGALPREEVTCPDCPMTNILPEMPSQEAGRIIHHLRWQHPETVQIAVTPIRPEIFLICWQEADKTTVVHVEDFENGIVYTNITQRGGAFICRRGTLTKVR